MEGKPAGADATTWMSWVAGWYERSGEILREVRIGPDGGVWRAGTVRGQIVLRRRLEPQEAAAGGVAVEMLTRACDTRDKWKVADVQRGLRRYVEWQERVEADAIVSPDGCRKTLSEGDRSWQAAGFAMTKHDGSVDRVGPLDDVCNYRAEMRAQLHAAAAEGRDESSSCSTPPRLWPCSNDSAGSARVGGVRCLCEISSTTGSASSRRSRWWCSCGRRATRVSQSTNGRIRRRTPRLKGGRGGGPRPKARAAARGHLCELRGARRGERYSSVDEGQGKCNRQAQAPPNVQLHADRPGWRARLGGVSERPAAGHFKGSARR